MPTKTRGSSNGHEGIHATIEPTRTSRSDPVSATSVLNTSVLNDVEVEATADDSAVGAELDELQELEQTEPDRPTMVVPVVIPPTPRPTEDEAEDEPISPQRRHVLEHLLGMADLYARNGSLRQAIELYFTLIIEHDATEQSVQACDRIMAVAQRYESNGELRLARGIYERLLNKGVVVAGEIIISVADIDLVYLNVQVLLASVETARRAKFRHEPPLEAGSLQWSPSGP